MYNLIRRVINTEYGQEVVIEKKYKLHKDQYKNRLWVLQPQDPQLVALNNKMKEQGLWT